MKPLVAEILAIVQMRCPESAWTSDLILAHLNWKRGMIQAPEIKMRRVREHLKVLVDLGHVVKDAQKSGRVQWNTYSQVFPEPIIPEYIISYKYKHRPFLFWASVIIAPALLGLFSGWMT